MLECSLSLQRFYCLNFSALAKSWWVLTDDRPKRPGVHFLLSIFVAWSFPGDSGSIEPSANLGNIKTRDRGLIPRSGRSPGGGQDNPLQYSCLENPNDRESWRSTVHGDALSQT